MLNKSRLWLICAIFFLFSVISVFAQEETFTITTYYPSPYGSYNELRTDQMSIGSGYATSTLSNGNLIVEGNVGIGTASPDYTLQVNGNIVPESDSGCDLGTSSLEWDFIYSNNALQFTGSHEFPIQEDTNFEVGDVVIIENGELKKSYRPRDPRVVGIYEIIKDGKYVIAGVGDNQVKNIIQGFKICNEGGEVREGNLLTTSSLPGYLMRQVDGRGNYDNVIRDYTVGKAMKNVEFDSQGRAKDIYGFIYSG